MLIVSGRRGTVRGLGRPEPYGVHVEATGDGGDALRLPICDRARALHARERDLQAASGHHDGAHRRS